MIRLTKLLLIGILLASVTSIRLQNQFLTFNTSASKYVISTSIATNLDKQFTLYSPVLVDTKDFTTTFSPSETKKKLLIEPKFVDDERVLYNDFYEGQYWYGFKKTIKPSEQESSESKFALTKITLNQSTHDYLIPLFSLPLSFLNFKSLYRCDDVLISYQKTQRLIDITVFSTEESWHLFPEATWGFRNKEGQINFSRQTYPLGSTIQIDVKDNKYCVLSEDLPENGYELVQKEAYTLSELLLNYSGKLEIREKTSNEQL